MSNVYGELKVEIIIYVRIVDLETARTKISLCSSDIMILKDALKPNPEQIVYLPRYSTNNRFNNSILTLKIAGEWMAYP